MIDHLYRVQSVVPVPDTDHIFTLDLQRADGFGGLTLTGVDLRPYWDQIQPGDYYRLTLDRVEEPAP